MTESERVDLAIRLVQEPGPPAMIPGGYFQGFDQQREEIRETAKKYLQSKLRCDASEAA